MSTEGTGSRSQTGHSHNGQKKCADFTVSSANGFSCPAHPNREECRHMRELSKYTCRYCASDFEDKNQLSHHVKTMHRDKQFTCNLCQRSYVSKIGLDEHVDKVHKKLIKYQCEICGKGFFGLSLYLDHVAVHTGVKRYTCLICDMGFTNKGPLKIHVLHFHPNEAANIL